MLDPTLSTRHQELLRAERTVLAALRAQLERLGAPAGDRQALTASLGQLDELFLLVVVGEFNAGKSALINALLGAAVAEEGVTPTTTRLGVLRFGEVAGRERQADGSELVTAPVELLRRLVLVDTPGTNAVFREHEALTRDYVPRADLVLFVTSADRPFSESERGFLAVLAAWGKKLVVVLNKADLLAGAGELEQVLTFVREQALARLSLMPTIFAVSARAARQARRDGDVAGLAASGLPALESFLAATLGSEKRVRLKLLNPLGVGRRVAAGAQELMAERRALLAADVTALSGIEEQLALYREDTGRDFRFRLSDVERVLADFEARGHAFFEDTLRPGRLFDLLNQARIRDEFAQRVVADLPGEVEQRVDAIVDWTVTGELGLWQAVMARLGPRQSAHGDRLLGRVDPAFVLDRQRLLDEVRREAQRAVGGYDARAEGQRLAARVREAVAGAAMLQVGAVSLGAAVTVLATTSLADVTGIAAAGVVSLVGFLLLPARRRQARRDLEVKVRSMREHLVRTLTASFEGELDRSLQRLREAIAPYSRFVRAENEALDREATELAATGGEISRLAAALEEERPDGLGKV